MGRRSRKRAQAPAEAVGTTDYADPEGNVLTLRNSVSAGTAEKVRRLDSSPGASLEDRAARRSELLFERLAVRWEIAGLPLEGQKELLGRFRIAGTEERRWVADTIARHLAEHQPELTG